MRGSGVTLESKGPLNHSRFYPGDLCEVALREMDRLPLANRDHSSDKVTMILDAKIIRASRQLVLALQLQS